MRDNAILPPTASGDGAGARCVSTAVQRRPAMKLGSASVRRCRLPLHFAAAFPEKTSEFLENPIFFSSFYGDLSQGTSEVTVESGSVESGWNFEDYIRVLSCHLFGPVNHEQTWKGWERSGEKA